MRKYEVEVEGTMIFEIEAETQTDAEFQASAEAGMEGMVIINAISVRDVTEDEDE